MTRYAWFAAATAAALAGVPVLPVHAQEPPPPDSGQAAAPAVPTPPQTRTPVTPAGAFVRSLLLPGWGQAALGSYTRGGIYFAAQTGSRFMLLKTMARIAEARSVERHRIDAVRSDLLARAAEDTALQKRYAHADSLAADVALDPAVTGIRSLIESRTQQREDWVAWTAFWLLAGAVDAYVTAHFADFPAQMTAEPTTGGGMRLRVSVPTGGPP